jgi:L-alanine-DL-glutamate epimerase-like enolase superfamily enzyme
MPGKGFEVMIGKRGKKVVDHVGFEITDVKAIPLRFPLASTVADARYAFTSRQAVLVIVEVRNGLRGIGEAASFGGSVESLCAAIHHDLRPLVVGEDARRVSPIVRRLMRVTYQRSRRGLVLAGISGLDIALWDIVGKAAELPLFEIFGADEAPIALYASTGFYPAEKSKDPITAEVSGAINRGIRAVKMKVGGYAADEDAQRVALVRELIGPSTKLMIDANCSYSPKEAVAFWQRVARFDIEWFEEPTNFDDLRGAAFVAARVGCPVAGYETEGTVSGFSTLIERKTVDILQPDATWCGGISEVLKIAALAEAHNLPLTVHAFGSAVGFFANLQVLASRPRDLPMELDVTPNGLRDELVSPSVDSLIADGAIRLPDGPGLGIELREEALCAYSVSEVSLP